MMVRPGIKFKPVERLSLDSYRNFSEIRPNVPVENVPCHAHVGRRFAHSDVAGKDYDAVGHDG